jgi:protease I
MAGANLEGFNVAILATDGFEQVELMQPRQALDGAGANTRVIAPKRGKIRGWKFIDWGDEVAVDLALEDAKPEQFDALVLPGGVISPDKLRMLPQAVAFVKAFFEARRPVAAICHGPWTMIETGAVRGRRMTSWPSVRTDLINAGAHWVDEAMVRDDNLITSRKPDDIPAFIHGMIELFGQASQHRQAA